MQKTVFKINKMDCPCEEQLIRLKLEEFPSVSSQEFDLTHRTLTLYHTDDVTPIETAIASLKLDSSIIDQSADVVYTDKVEDNKQRRALWWVLIINFAFFGIEMTSGLISGSMGLVADSLDMLADTFVYSLSLLVVGAALVWKKRVAGITGYSQLILSVMGFVEVIRRLIGFEEAPHFQTMIGISILALIANAVCVIILQKTKSKDAHIQGSLICSSNDVIVNMGVIVAGLLVWMLDSAIPDLIVGTVVFIIVTRGAVRILKLSR